MLEAVLFAEMVETAWTEDFRSAFAAFDLTTRDHWIGMVKGSD
jgi:hypothetical protein